MFNPIRPLIHALDIPDSKETLSNIKTVVKLFNSFVNKKYHYPIIKYLKWEYITVYVVGGFLQSLGSHTKKLLK